MRANTLMIPVELSESFLETYQGMFLNLARESIEKAQEGFSHKQYMNKKEAAQYIGISFNTFQKLEKRGLPIIEIDGVMLVKKQDIDEFLNTYKSSFVK